MRKYSPRIRPEFVVTGSLNGSFRPWTGDLGYEEAEFSFEFSWGAQGTGNGSLYPGIDLAALCDMLGVEGVSTLTLRTDSEYCIGSGESFQRVLLRKLPGAKVVEWCVYVVQELRSPWCSGSASRFAGIAERVLAVCRLLIPR
jgi:hypothetical protein